MCAFVFAVPGGLDRAWQREIFRLERVRFTTREIGFRVGRSHPASAPFVSSPVNRPSDLKRSTEQRKKVQRDRNSFHGSFRQGL